MAPRMGRNRTCIPTENDIQYGRNESGATGIPKNETVDVPAASAAVLARLATYGPKNTVPTVVLKAEFAQSYIAQPKISLRSLTTASVAILFSFDVVFEKTPSVQGMMCPII